MIRLDQVNRSLDRIGKVTRRIYWVPKRVSSLLFNCCSTKMRITNGSSSVSFAENFAFPYARKSS